MFLHAPQKMPRSILMLFNFFGFIYGSFHPLLLDGSLFGHTFEMFREFHQLNNNPIYAAVQ